MARSTSRRFSILALLAPILAFSQEAPAFPSWLECFPGAVPTVRTVGAVRQSTYTTAAQPAHVVEHYRGLLGGAGLVYQISPDAAGTSIRASARECSLLIRVANRSEGSLVGVTCSAKTESPGTTVSTDAQWTRLGGNNSAPALSSDIMQRHQQKVAELGIHREHYDAPAPPLVWPSWLADIRGAELRPQAGADQAKNATLRARYTTSVPMTEIYDFYRDLLASHEYPVSAHLSTGHTQTGIVQNADGSVEGFNYPDGAPGAYSVIKVSFDRSVLNGPITVTLLFTTHEYIAKRGY